MHPSPLQCPRVWWGSDVPVDAIHLFHIRDWVAARLHGLPGPIHSLTPQTRAGMIPVLLAHPVLAWLLRLCLLFPHAMSRVSSIADGLCKQAVIKSAYSLGGGQLIKSTWGAETHTGSINPSLASLLSLRMSVFFLFAFLFFPFFQRENEDYIS